MTKILNNFCVTSINVGRGLRQAELLTYINTRIESTSVFCFQESDREIRELIDDILLGEFVGHYATKPAEPNDYNLSTYVRRNIDATSESVVCGDTEGTGVALRCELVDDRGRKIVVSNIHGAAFPGHKLDTPERLELSRQLVKLAGDSNDIQVVAGDFNLLPEAESVRMFAANGFRNLIDEFAIPTTRNELAWRNYPPEAKQLFADYTFVRGDDLDCSFFVDAVEISDHLPMILEIHNDSVLSWAM